MYADELKFPVSDIKGIGQVTAKTLAKAGVFTVADLLRYIPRDYENRKKRVPLSSVPSKKEVNTVIEIVAHDFIGFGRKKTLKVYIKDTTATGVLICFGRNFLKNKLAVGKHFFLYGLFDIKYGEIQSTQFEVEEYSGRPLHFNRILPVYPLSGNLKQGTLRNVIKTILEKYSNVIENQLPEKIIRKYHFPPRSGALKNIHFPDSEESMATSMELMKYEELFYLQLAVARRAIKFKQHTRDIKKVKTSLKEKLLDTLPFSLTPDQINSLEEIKQDMESDTPMYRLLQGDVGSGKTLVAFISSLGVIERGGQSAFMAPTELLARQHAENAVKLLQPLGIRIAFLSGNISGKQRKPLLDALKKGNIDLLIGTHALFTGDVVFKNLEFVIVDEQHKFGVIQRLALLNKGKTPDLLLMTATPIPRTLTMTVFADLDVSTIRTMPEGRKPVITHLSRMENEQKVYEAVRKELQKGHQAYFVYPRIARTGNEASADLKDAETMFVHLQKKIFPEYTLALIHSKVSDTEKISIMNKFNRNSINILVATSVVEVGVDVKNATCMVIEHAERFGLSGLHQLRGRVGRGEVQSYAFLIYSDKLSEIGKERLKVMMKYHDGFSLAEEDLRIRGPGELAGKKQSGFLRLTFADIIEDTRILNSARKDALSILRSDPGFIHISNKMIREIFERCPPFEDRMLSSG